MAHTRQRGRVGRPIGMKGGTPMTDESPPHRTGRAGFPHPALGVPFFSSLHEVTSWPTAERRRGRSLGGVVHCRKHHPNVPWSCHVSSIASLGHVPLRATAFCLETAMELTATTRRTRRSHIQ